MSEARPRILCLIPARGGSKGIPRKNVRSLAGRPLLAYAIALARASSHRPDVVVTSEDQEILTLARKFGAGVHHRDSSLADDVATLDDVVRAAVPEIERARRVRYDMVVTQQPTSPLLQVATLDRGIASILADEHLDTVISAVAETHLSWRRDDDRFVPLYAARVNRQQLTPTYRETGGFLVCRRTNLDRGSRVGDAVSLCLVGDAEAIDIDTAEDWARCEWHLGRRSVLFAVAGNREIGLGHVHNALTVANGLTTHRVEFLVTRDSELARETIAAYNYEVSRVASPDLGSEVIARKPDVVINDRLDTASEEIRRLKSAGIKVVNFEDLGDGALEADLVINAIYPEATRRKGHYFGQRYFCARDEFIHTEPRPVAEVVQRVLVTFGGVDPANLTLRVLDAIAAPARARGIVVEVIAGRGYRAHETIAGRPGVEVHRSVMAMADHIRAADIAFTSAGRTVFEIACLGTPAIVLAQNERELTHLFATAENGFANLGLGIEVTAERIATEFVALVDDPVRRVEMQRRQLGHELRLGTARVLRLIEQMVGET